ncbi:BppU family phage baseplate upper protein [Peptococcus simiae]|uniref:BppU family phage baseplate upper protein n=1 Tax=Peptococcus simiae TaxID=1643805 RepID=UPI00397F9FED
MALDTFRRIDIILDTANDRVDWQTPLNANTGEYNSRNLRVQLTNGGVVEPQKADLYFGFRHVETGNNGVYPMKRVDANQGIYEVYYPSEMLTTAGSVICAIKIVEDSNGRHINKTANFTVDVKKSAIDDNMEVAENSLRVFDKMLLDVQVNGRKIIVVEDTVKEILREYKDLQTWLKNNVVKQSQIAELTKQNKEIAFNAGKIDHLSKTAPLLDIFKNLYVMAERIESDEDDKSINLNKYIGTKISPSTLNNENKAWSKKTLFKIQGSGILLGISSTMNHRIDVEYSDEYNYDQGFDYTGTWSYDGNRTKTKSIYPDERHYNINIKADGKTIMKALGDNKNNTSPEIRFQSLYGFNVISSYAKNQQNLIYANMHSYPFPSKGKVFVTGNAEKYKLPKEYTIGIEFEKELVVDIDVSVYPTIDLTSNPWVEDLSGYNQKKYHRTTYTKATMVQTYRIDGLYAIIFPK